MIQQLRANLTQLYDVDETAWLEAMVDLIDGGRRGDLDYSNLREYLSDMARRDRREVESRLATLNTHVLKWMHQPEHRSQSWRGTIIEQRQELARLVDRGVLRIHADVVLSHAYAEAIERAAAETGLAVESFPNECSWTVEQLLGPEFLGAF